MPHSAAFAIVTKIFRAGAVPGRESARAKLRGWGPEMARKGGAERTGGTKSGRKGDIREREPWVRQQLLSLLQPQFPAKIVDSRAVQQVEAGAQLVAIDAELTRELMDGWRRGEAGFQKLTDATEEPTVALSHSQHSRPSALVRLEAIENEREKAHDPAFNVGEGCRLHAGAINHCGRGAQLSIHGRSHGEARS